MDVWDVFELGWVGMVLAWVGSGWTWFESIRAYPFFGVLFLFDLKEGGGACSLFWLGPDLSIFFSLVSECILDRNNIIPSRLNFSIEKHQSNNLNMTWL